MVGIDEFHGGISEDTIVYESESAENAGSHADSDASLLLKELFRDNNTKGIIIIVYFLVNHINLIGKDIVIDTTKTTSTNTKKLVIQDSFDDNFDEALAKANPPTQAIQFDTTESDDNAMETNNPFWNMKPTADINANQRTAESDNSSRSFNSTTSESKPETKAEPKTEQKKSDDGSGSWSLWGFLK